LAVEGYSVTSVTNTDPKLLAQFVEHFQPPAIRVDVGGATAFDHIYQLLPARLPMLYERLLLTFMWDDVELPSFLLLANPGLDGLLTSLLYDRYLAEALLPKGFIPFGRAPGGGYDPICFNTRARAGRRDYPIVQVDHEDILCRGRLTIKEILAPSFRALVQTTIEIPGDKL